MYFLCNGNENENGKLNPQETDDRIGGGVRPYILPTQNRNYYPLLFLCTRFSLGTSNHLRVEFIVLFSIFFWFLLLLELILILFHITFLLGGGWFSGGLWRWNCGEGGLGLMVCMTLGGNC